MFDWIFLYTEKRTISLEKNDLTTKFHYKGCIENLVLVSNNIRDLAIFLFPRVSESSFAIYLPSFASGTVPFSPPTFHPHGSSQSSS